MNLGTWFHIKIRNAFHDEYKATQWNVYSERGLKFTASIEYLSDYFSELLTYRSLNQLIGETVHWIWLPNYIAYFALPFLLSSYSYLTVAIIMLVILGIGSVFISLFYFRWLNILSLLVAPLFIWLSYAFVWGFLFIINGSILNAIIVGVSFILLLVGVYDLIVGLFNLPIQLWIMRMPQSDCILRNIGWYHGRKLGLDIDKWGKTS